MNAFRRLLLIAAVLGLAACATGPGPLYQWGSYETDLYEYYKDSRNIDEYVASLEKIIDKGEETNQVPPGVYAEHGYALLVAGREEEAIASFERERERWPESERFMNAVIENVKLGGLGTVDIAAGDTETSDAI